MTPNSYSLAMLYHTHHGLHDEDIPFWLALATRYGDPILELGCGTGRVPHIPSRSRLAGRGPG